MTDKLKYKLLGIIFILGYSSLSFELILLRQLVNFVGSNALITSIVIAVILLFLCVGYYIGSTISVRRLSFRTLVKRIVYTLSFWYVFACSYYVLGGFFYLMSTAGIVNPAIQVLFASFLFAAAPSVALGFITSYFGRIVHHYNADYTGRFMAIDTLGSVSGSLLTTLFFMPLWGVMSAVTALVLLNSSVLLFVSKRKDTVSEIVLCVCFTAMAFVVANERIWFKQSGLVLDNAIARLELIPTDFEQGKPQSVAMIINGSNSSKMSVKEELMFPYIDYINSNYINNLPTDKTNDILILGAGGFTVGHNDTRNNYIYLDVIGELKDISEQRFLGKSLTANKKFVVQDAYLYMLRNTQKFDLIVVDLYSSLSNIPVNFVTADFFEMVKSSLKPNGIMVANIITSPAFKTKYSRRIDNTLRYVFKHSLSRQIIFADKPSINPYDDELYNVLYAYYNNGEDDEIYTIDKNSAVFGQ